MERIWDCEHSNPHLSFDLIFAKLEALDFQIMPKCNREQLGAFVQRSRGWESDYSEKITSEWPIPHRTPPRSID
jgi:hypothetical protein